MATHIDGKGIRLSRAYDGPLDVLIGGHRVWSFSTNRDARRSGAGLFVAWPRSLAELLEGRAEVALVPHNGGAALFSNGNLPLTQQASLVSSAEARIGRPARKRRRSSASTCAVA